MNFAPLPLRCAANRASTSVAMPAYVRPSRHTSRYSHQRCVMRIESLRALALCYHISVLCIFVEFARVCIWSAASSTVNG